MHFLRQFWIRIRSSLWFVPLSLVFAAIALAVVLIAADVAIGTDWTNKHPLVFGVGSAGARGMLAAIAGSMMTVASLTFSLTISTLATASSQYTSRLIRNFMRDRLNQFVLGYFVGLFAYCLVVLRTIRSGDEVAFVPPLAVLGGLALALVSIGVLIFFIHHIAGSIQVSIILRSVTKETLGAINGLFPADVGTPAHAIGDAAGPALVQTGDYPEGEVQAGYRWYAVSAARFGYVQSLDARSVLAMAAKADAVVRMSADIGAFVTPAGSLCEIAMATLPGEDLIKDLRGAFNIGAARSIEQDASYGIRQIVDIALRALSSGVNDTTTGVMCVNHLAAVLETLASRTIPDRLRAEDGKVRLVASERTFEGFAALCLDQIRQSASGNVAVMLALLLAVEAAGRQTSDEGRRQTLSRHASLLETLARESVNCWDDYSPIKTRADAILGELGPAGVPAA